MYVRSIYKLKQKSFLIRFDSLSHQFLDSSHCALDSKLHGYRSAFNIFLRIASSDYFRGCISTNFGQCNFPQSTTGPYEMILIIPCLLSENERYSLS